MTFILFVNLTKLVTKFIHFHGFLLSFVQKKIRAGSLKKSSLLLSTILLFSTEKI